MAHGKIPHSSSGWYIIEQHVQRRGNNEEPVVKLVTPVAQTLEQAKADLEEVKREAREKGEPISRFRGSRKRKANPSGKSRTKKQRLNREPNDIFSN